ncbi:hypothetical protein IQ238_03605 [Pleurocapsales cyanobacterium LEGE 06147]|nr:hypothetical protein [Pleurocapsales cyanobacterium LEGE 06147]
MIQAFKKPLFFLTNFLTALTCLNAFFLFPSTANNPQYFWKIVELVRNDIYRNHPDLVENLVLHQETLVQVGSYSVLSWDSSVNGFSVVEKKPSGWQLIGTFLGEVNTYHMSRVGGVPPTIAEQLRAKNLQTRRRLERSRS